MSDRDGPLLGRAVLAPPAALAVLLLVVWALTGAHYFWPMWVWFALALPLSLVRATRWVQRRPADRRRGLGAQAVDLLRRDRRQRRADLADDRGRLLLAGVAAAGARRTDRDLAAGAAPARAPARGPGRRADPHARGSRRRAGVRATPDRARSARRRTRRGWWRCRSRSAAPRSGSPRRALIREISSSCARPVARLRQRSRSCATSPRGISPPVLADRGLQAAVQSLADRSGPNVQVYAEIGHRPPPAVENAAYFVVAESLTNARKHASAAPVQINMVQINIWHERSQLGIVVADEGPGGADPGGSGLSGLRKRVEALDGWLEVTSPTGHGTTVRAMLPSR